MMEKNEEELVYVSVLRCPRRPEAFLVEEPLIWEDVVEVKSGECVTVRADMGKLSLEKDEFVFHFSSKIVKKQKRRFWWWGKDKDDETVDKISVDMALQYNGERKALLDDAEMEIGTKVEFSDECYVKFVEGDVITGVFLVHCEWNLAKKRDNLKFYRNELRSRPDNMLVTEFHDKWRTDFDSLE